MKTSTIPVEAPKWHLVDAEGQTLGKLSAYITPFLRGKTKPNFSPHQLCGDHVIVINAAKMALHPTKLYRKTYKKHTGYPGSLKITSLKDMMEKDPADVIVRAVKGMLPKNRLNAEVLKRLHVFSDEKHSHEAQKPTPLSLS